MKERFLLVFSFIEEVNGYKHEGAVISIRNVSLANRKFVQEILDEVMIGLT